jgi:hypothetical protein
VRSAAAVPPKRVDEPIRREDAVRVERQDRQERALHAPPDLDALPADRHLDRPEQLDLQPQASWFGAVHPSSL